MCDDARVKPHLEVWGSEIATFFSHFRRLVLNYCNVEKCDKLVIETLYTVFIYRIDSFYHNLDIKGRGNSGCTSATKISIAVMPSGLAGWGGWLVTICMYNTVTAVTVPSQGGSMPVQKKKKKIGYRLVPLSF